MITGLHGKRRSFDSDTGLYDRQYHRKRILSKSLNTFFGDTKVPVQIFPADSCPFTNSLRSRWQGIRTEKNLRHPDTSSSTLTTHPSISCLECLWFVLLDLYVVFYVMFDVFQIYIFVILTHDTVCLLIVYFRIILCLINSSIWYVLYFHWVHPCWRYTRRRVTGVTLSTLYYTVRDSVRCQFTPSMGVTLLGVVKKGGHTTHTTHHTAYGRVLGPQNVSTYPDMCDSLRLSGGSLLSTLTLTVHSKEGDWCLSVMYWVVRDSERCQFTPSMGVTLLGVVRKGDHVTQTPQYIFTLVQFQGVCSLGVSDHHTYTHLDIIHTHIVIDSY